MKYKIWVIGCGGMLGKAFYNTFSSICHLDAYDIDTNEVWLNPGNITDYSFCRKSIETHNPDIIVNLAAETDLEYCEKNVDTAYRTNALGPEMLAYIASKLDKPLIQVSTAGIFDGSKATYTEYDNPNPLSVYGKSKYEGEKAVLKYKNAFVFRAGWMMGGGKKDKKFINKILKQINAGQKEIFAVNDKFGTPTYTNDFAKNILTYVREGLLPGLYNLVCNGECNRFDVAKYLCNKIDSSIKVTEVGSSYFSKEYFATRPYSEALINFKLKLLGIDKMRDWKECVDDYLKELDR
jgi:dTDP-4-dehydrorhamnose reductase